jgi:hypothetical protein
MTSGLIGISVCERQRRREGQISTKDPMAVVRQYIDGFNKGDAKAMAETFAVPGSILDGMVPHLWQGPTAAQD